MRILRITVALITLLTISFSELQSQIDSVRYMISYDTVNCRYDANMVVVGGEAYSGGHRAGFNAQYTIVVPGLAGIQVVASHNPIRNNLNFMGTVPAPWNISTSVQIPEATDSLESFYAITPSLSPTAYYDSLNTGDVVPLFSFVVTPTEFCGDSIRPFENGVDPSGSEPGMGGGDFSNGFTIGGFQQKYVGNNTPIHAPVPVLSATTMCSAGIEIDLTSLSSSCQTPVNYSWTGPLGHSSSAEDVIIDPATSAHSGVYMVTVTDALGCVSTLDISAVAKPNAGMDQTACQGGSITLQGIDPVNGAWTADSNNNPGATLSGMSLGTATANFDNTASGIYNFIYTANTCSDTIEVSVTSSDAGADPNDVNCFSAGTTTLSADMSQAGVWSVGSNSAGTAVIADPMSAGTTVSTFSASGTYFLVWTVDGCMDTVTFQANDNCTCVILNNTLTPFNPSTICGTSGNILIDGGAVTSTTGTYLWEYSLNANTFASAPGANTAEDYTTVDLSAGVHAFRRIFTTDTGVICSDTSNTVSLTVFAFPNTPTNLTADPNPICLGQTINLSVSNVPNVLYTWSTTPASGSGLVSSTSSATTMTPTATGIFSVNVTATENGCESGPATIDVEVFETPITPTIGSITPTNPTSCGSADGTISIAGYNANETYDISFTFNGNPQSQTVTANGSGELLLTNLLAGNYSNISITNSNNCESGVFTGSIGLSDPNPPPAPANITAIPNPECLGSPITISVDNTPGATYTWSSPSATAGLSASTTNTVTMLATEAGLYLVEVTQTIAGCTSTESGINVLVNGTPPSPNAGNVIGTDPTACGGTDGFITLSELTPFVSYIVHYNDNGTDVTDTLSTNSNGELNILNLGEGVYSNFSLSNFTNCTSAEYAGPINLVDPNSPPAPTNLVGAPDPSCLGQDVILSVDDNPSATFNWSVNSANAALDGSTDNTNVMVANAAGVFTVSVSQTVAGCTSPAASIDLSVFNIPPDISGSSFTNPSVCSGSDGTITLTGLDVSTSYTLNYEFNGNPISLMMNTNASGEFVLTGLSSGIYENFQALNAAGCSNMVFGGPINLVDPSAPAAPDGLTAAPDRICLGETVNLSVNNTNGATYTWSASPGTSGLVSSTTNTTSMTPTAAGTYTISVFQTIGGCVSPAASIDVIVDPLPSTPNPAFITSMNPSQCLATDGSITIGGYEAFRSYTVQYTYQGAVVSGTFSTNAQGEFTIPNLGSGAYTNFSVTNSGGCTSLVYAGPVNLVDPGAPGAPSNLMANPNPVCLGGEVALSVTNNPNSVYSWSAPNDAGLVASMSNTTTMLATQPGTYTVSVIQTIAGCTSPAATIDVDVLPIPYTPTVDDFSGTDPSSCGVNDGQITILGFVPNTEYTIDYELNGIGVTMTVTSDANGILLIPNLGPGDYSNFVFTNAGNCSSGLFDGTITLLGPQAPPAPTNLIGNPNPSCLGELVMLSVDDVSGATFTWSASSPNAGLVTNSTNMTQMQATAPGIYTIEVYLTLNGCNSPSATIEIVVNELPPNPTAGTVNFTNPSACSVSDGGITISGYNSGEMYDLEYNLNGISTVANLIADGSGVLNLTDLGPGTYSDFVVVNAVGCSSGAYAGPIVLVEPNLPDAPIGLIAAPNPICLGQAALLFVEDTPGATYEWFISSPDGGLTQSTTNSTTMLPTAAGIYTVSVTQTISGCTSPAAEIQVQVRASCLNPDFGATFDDVLLSGDLSTNDMQMTNALYGDPLAVGTNPSGDIPSVNTDGTYTFTSSTIGEYNYTVEVCEGQFCYEIPLVITVLDKEESNHAPVINHDYIGVNGDNSIVINISSNDRCESVPNCTLTNATIITPPFFGTFSVGTGIYTPNAGFIGRDSFLYESCQTPVASPLNCDQEWVYINVYAPSSSEFTNAMDDYAETNLNSELIATIFDGVGSNDIDPIGISQTVTAYSSTVAGKGTLVLSSDGSYIFTPATDFIGPVDFAYRTCRSNNPGICDEATLHILVHPLGATGIIGDYAWVDENGNGIQDGNEDPIEGIIIKLYNDQDIVVNTTVTDNDGEYMFFDVIEGNYYLEFMVPAELEPTLVEKGNQNNDSDITNSNGLNTTDMFYITGGETNLTIDGGFYECVKIGDRVWYDINENDVFEDFENGINGLKVRLYRLENGSYELWDNTTTGHKPNTPSDDGYWQFCVAPGTYYVEIVMPPIGLVLVRPFVGNDSNRDSDINHANGTGTTSSFTLKSGESKLDLGAGYYPMATAGNLVWNDTNNNGIQDPAESRVSGVLVQAYDAATSQMVGEAVTDADGVYEIDYLDKRDVYLKFAPPTGYSATIHGAGDDNMDSDVDDSYGLNTTRMFSLAPGDALVNIDMGIAQGILPVEWVSVDAYAEDAQNVIEWETAQEINVDYFIVERRAPNEFDFNPISEEQIASKNKSNNKYQAFDDKVEVGGDFYYRIKQVDFDGTIDFSKEVVVSRDLKSHHINAYPNPLTTHLDIEYISRIGDMFIVDVFNRDGRLVKSKSFRSNDEKLNTYRLDMQDIPDGMYNITIQVGNVIEHKSFIKIR